MLPLIAVNNKRLINLASHHEANANGSRNIRDFFHFFPIVSVENLLSVSVPTYIYVIATQLLA